MIFSAIASKSKSQSKSNNNDNNGNKVAENLNTEGEGQGADIGDTDDGQTQTIQQITNDTYDQDEVVIKVWCYFEKRYTQLV